MLIQGKHINFYIGLRKQCIADWKAEIITTANEKAPKMLQWLAQGYWAGQLNPVLATSAMIFLDKMLMTAEDSTSSLLKTTISVILFLWN